MIFSRGLGFGVWGLGFGVWANNGRMLWKVAVFYEETNLNEFIFPNGWNYLNFDIFDWELEDTQNRFFYLPVETQSVLINAETLQIHRLKKQNLSTARYVCNFFEDDFLVEIYGDTTVKTSLKTLVSQEIKY